MPFDEVFARPVVKEVCFQVRFPNLFFIENKIGDLQSAIMRTFPESNLLLRKDFVFAQRVQGSAFPLTGKEERLPEADAAYKIWEFKNAEGVAVQVARDNFSIFSQQHKSYSHAAATQRFRDVVELVCTEFFRQVSIPVATRIGLRYVNHCPVLEKTTGAFRGFYDSALPLDRFPLEEASDIEFSTVIVRQAAKLRYKEQFPIADDTSKLLLDLDAWAERVEPANILATADTLHNIIGTEFERFAKPSLIAYMRNQDAPLHDD